MARKQSKETAPAAAAPVDQPTGAPAAPVASPAPRPAGGGVRFAVTQAGLLGVTAVGAVGGAYGMTAMAVTAAGVGAGGVGAAIAARRHRARARAAAGGRSGAGIPGLGRASRSGAPRGGGLLRRLTNPSGGGAGGRGRGLNPFGRGRSNGAGGGTGGRGPGLLRRLRPGGSGRPGGRSGLFPGAGRRPGRGLFGRGPAGGRGWGPVTGFRSHGNNSSKSSKTGLAGLPGRLWGRLRKTEDNLRNQVMSLPDLPKLFGSSDETTTSKPDTSAVPDSRTPSVPTNPATSAWPSPSTTSQGGALMGAMQDAADQFAAAVNRTPLTSARNFELAMDDLKAYQEAVARTIEQLGNRIQELGIMDTAIPELVYRHSKRVEQFGTTTEEIKEQARRIHKDRWERLENPMRGERAWDSDVNNQE